MREGCRWKVVAVVVGVVILHISWKRARMALFNGRMSSQGGWRRYNGHIGDGGWDFGIELEF